MFVTGQRIPAHVWRLHACRKTFASYMEQSQAWSLGRFLAGIEHPLHPYADAEETSPSSYAFHDCASKAGLVQDSGRRKMSNARQNDLVRVRHHIRIARDH